MAISDKSSRTIARTIVCVAFVAAASLGEASAQRTMRSQGHLSIESVSAVNYNTWPGGRISYGTYLLSSMWQAGLECDHFGANLSSGHMLDYLDVNLFAGWQKRLAATRSRNLCLYAGGGATLGYEFMDPWRTIPPHVDIGVAKDTFIYGVYAKTEMEFFPVKKVALILSATASANIPSKIRWYHFTTSLGIRIDI